MWVPAHVEQVEPVKPVEQLHEQEPAVPDTLNAWLLQSVAVVHSRTHVGYPVWVAAHELQVAPV